MLAWRLHADPRDPLGLLFTGAAGRYAWGWLPGNLIYGRALGFALLAAHLALGIWAAGQEAHLRHGHPHPARARAALATLAALLLVGLAGIAPGLVRTIPTPLLPGSLRADARLTRTADTYRFLTACVGPDDVVLANLGRSSLIAPAFAGKLVATGWPVPFVSDHEARQADAERFFHPDHRHRAPPPPRHLPGGLGPRRAGRPRRPPRPGSHPHQPRPHRRPARRPHPHRHPRPLHLLREPGGAAPNVRLLSLLAREAWP